MSVISRTYNEIKNLSVSKKLTLQYKQNERAYYVFVLDDIGTTYQCIIYKQSFLDKNVVIGVNQAQNTINQTDFETNYKSTCDQNVSMLKPKTDDNRDFIYTSARPINCHTVFVGEGDDMSNYKFIGGGSQIELTHKIGDPLVHTLYIDFNIVDNPTYIHEGYITFSGCKTERLSFHFVPRLTSFVPAQNTTFTLVNGFLIVPAPGNGNIQLTEMPNLVCVGTDSNNMPNPGFWDADFNFNTGAFDNLRPNPYGQGAYNIFGNEIIVYRMLQRIPLKGDTNGDGKETLTTSEQGQMLHGFRLKCIFEVIGDDHDCEVSSILVLYREKATQLTR